MFVAGSVRDAAGVQASPGAVAVAGDRILASGEVAEVRRIAGGDAPVIDLPDRLLIPGLVNAHTHLQMTAIGRREYGGDFGAWVMDCMMVWHACIEEHGGDESAALAASMAEGVRRSRSAGVLTVGDIASWNLEAHELLRAAPLRGVGYVELVGIGGEKLARGRARLAEVVAMDQTHAARTSAGGQVHLGLEPHAPYSTGPALYEAAARLATERDIRLTTHLAELPEEQQFIAEATGAMRDLLDQLARWDESYLEFYGHGLSPVRWMEPHLRRARWLCAHCNYVNDDDMALLADTGASVAYCPRASEYFNHIDHPYRVLLEAGVNVCLGTDSIVCHGSLSILDEMRRLYQRDATDPALLLAMATTRGMRGLCLDEADATFAVGRSPGVVAVRYDPTSDVEALEQVLRGSGAVDIEVLCEAKCSSKETP